jgi:crotonobetainyl-CoA:carnitine CoA-transferase CaiB-like acyl-CoA transferase
MPQLPLTGLRVLEITVVWAGPYCGSFLADLGAEVIRVESTNTFVPLTRGAAPHPPQAVIDNLPLYSGGVPDRVPGERPFNRSPMFNSHARNKRSMTVNLLEPGGREIFDRLVSISDVLIENNPTETMEKLGISYESLQAVKDDFIMLRMPAYGSTGPYRDYRAHGVHIEGVVGHTQLRGYTDTDPSYNTTVLMSDAAAGVQGAFAVLAALRHRKRTGEGQLVELGQAENVFPFLGEYYMDYVMNGRTHETPGNRHPTALQNCYPCAGNDRWIVITVYDRQQWQALCTVIGSPELASDPELQDAAARLARQNDIDPHIAAWTSTQSPTDAMNILQRAGVPAGAVMNQADAFADPHIRNRQFFQPASQADCGTHLYHGALYKMSETPLGIQRGPVMLGQDNDYVYQTLLGYSAAECAEFEAAGHIGTDYAAGVGEA